jgi:hypothetical protein
MSSAAGWARSCLALSHISTSLDSYACLAAVREACGLMARQGSFGKPAVVDDYDRVLAFDVLLKHPEVRRTSFGQWVLILPIRWNTACRWSMARLCSRRLLCVIPVLIAGQMCAHVRWPPSAHG